MKTCPSCQKLYPTARRQCPACGVELRAAADAGGGDAQSTHAVKLSTLRQVVSDTPGIEPNGATAKVSQDMRAKLEAALAAEQSNPPEAGGSTERIDPTLQNRLAAALVEENPTVDYAAITENDAPPLAEEERPEPSLVEPAADTSRPTPRASKGPGNRALIGLIVALSIILLVLLGMLLLS